MDEPLEFTLRDLFFVVGYATQWLPSITREAVFQWLCYKMERRVSVESLRAAMQEMGFTKEERCVHCNEVVANWDFEDGEDPICEDCLN